MLWLGKIYSTQPAFTTADIFTACVTVEDAELYNTACITETTVHFSGNT